MGTLPLAAAIGPLLAGVLLALGGWRAIFFRQSPARRDPAAARPALARTGDGAGGGRPLRPRGCADPLGGPRRGRLALNRGLARADGIAAVGVAVLAAALFAVQELRYPRPLVELRLFRSPQFLAANAAVALSNLALYVTLFALPILLGRRGGWTASEIGLVLTTLTLTATMFASSPAGRVIADRYGSRRPAWIGLALMTACLVPFALAAGRLSAVAIVASLCGVGTGVGLASVPLQLAALEAVDVSASGIVSGIFSTSRYLGSIAGISLLAGPLAPAATGLGGFRVLFAVVAAAAALSAAFAPLLPRRHALERGVSAEVRP
jgi:sugar phosphate permease